MTTVEMRMLKKAILVAAGAVQFLKSNVPMETKIKYLMDEFDVKARENLDCNYAIYRRLLRCSYTITEADIRELARMEGIKEPKVIEFIPSKSMTASELEFDNKLAAIIEAEERKQGVR